MSDKIYGLLDPNNREVRYVGKTSKTLSRRLNAHVSKSKIRDGIPVFDWISSLGSRPDIGLIEKIEGDDWREAERAWIEYFSSEYDLLNVLPGGEGTPSGEQHPCFGKKLSQEHKEKISDAVSGKNNPFYGNTHTEDTKKKISSAHKGKKISREQKKQLHVLSYLQASEVRRLYESTDFSQQELAEAFGVSVAVICRIVNGKTYNE